VLETSSNNNTIVGNNVASNYNGILVGYYSDDNAIYHNNFLHNTVQVVHITSGCVNVWDNGYPSGGNFWSDYNGTDANGDGIGDTPYVINANNRDNYPLMTLYQYSYSPWDLNDDGYVGIDDILVAAYAFGTIPGMSRWNPKADINRDGYIGIDDIFIIAQHFGQEENP
jgi:parallel beta-helix repeat protein